jgi:N6-adenosine-specific RNA methylase IME4
MDELTSRALARDDSRILPLGDMFDGLPLKTFGCIYADPPWEFKTRSSKGQGRSPSRHYATRPLADILEDPVGEIAADDSFLFLWITGPLIVQGVHRSVFEAWGFKPSSVAFVWIKTNSAETVASALTWDDVLHAGLGFGTMQNAEYVLLGRRGSPKRLSKNVRQVVVAPRRRHSEKPEEVAKRIERFCEGPRIELYARKTRPGWTMRGDQVGLLDNVA